MDSPREPDKPPEPLFVFLNCPFNEAYRSKMFQQLLFCILDCGFYPRCALERENAAESRLEKIKELLEESPLSIHDLSQTELDPHHGLPHFNMAFELGLFFGALFYGQGEQREKTCLILDREGFRYRDFLSDIAGRDIKAHADDPNQVIEAVRAYLSNWRVIPLPSGKSISKRYRGFQIDLPAIAAGFKLDPDALSYRDLIFAMKFWLSSSPQ